MGVLLSGITQGRSTRSVAAGGAVVHQVVYTPGAFMPTHAHRRANITLVLAGSVDDEAEGDLFRAGALSVVIKPSSIEHRTTCGARGLRTLVVELDAAAEKRLCGTLGMFRRCVWMSGGAMARQTVRLWAGLREGLEKPSSLIDAWFAGLPDARALHPEPPAEGRAAGGPLAAALTELVLRGGAGVHTAELARSLSIHPSTLRRLFQRGLGVGVMARARRERVRRTAERLAMSRESMARIAAEGGFADQSHLCRDFKRETGLSPGRYRELVQAAAGT